MSMTKQERNDFKADLYEAVAEALDGDGVRFRPDYSGRGMKGMVVPALVGPSGMGPRIGFMLAYIAQTKGYGLVQVRDLLPGSTDAMGRDVVYY